MKNSLEQLIKQWIWASKRISKPEAGTIEMTQSKKQKEKRMKESDQSLGTPSNQPIHIMGVLGQEREKGQKEYLKK